MELVLNGLHATRFRPFQESPHVEEKSQGSEAACKVLQSNIRIPNLAVVNLMKSLQEEKGQLKYLTRPCLKGKPVCLACSSLLWVPEKTSLVRTLSGEDFIEERRETHGIDTSMVEMTE
ncbi:hypothetical protein OS493_021843 [Desmophyllum pertusum]|uniref:Uncharacterized protein n=1 Tax=Desmophyllum pertusum TaxID=174260 RepID=A0A9X0D2R1_9CNID|nr:hypothetical protein OS493_021843 [Desmophyllum pertusum]